MMQDTAKAGVSFWDGRRVMVRGGAFEDGLRATIEWFGASRTAEATHANRQRPT
jgi:hypothetical protein